MENADTLFKVALLERDKEILETLVKQLEEYCNLLGDECSDLVGMASVHGWKSNRYEKGVEIRSNIKETKSFLSDDSPVRQFEWDYKDQAK